MNWSCAIYGRVSTDSEEQQESIKVQKEALAKYGQENGFQIVEYFFDDGYTGTTFERPGMDKLKQAVEDGRINLILVKDLSRIGRNNSLTLMFLDYLRMKNVRLIAINDGYDTLQDEDDLVGIKTWINERYSKDISKKIKFALKHKKSMGQYLTAFAPFGYKKSVLVKNKLEVDIPAAAIVRRIYDMYLNGYGFIKISNILQEEGVPTPSSFRHYSRKSNNWNWTTVKRIITNPVYTGCAVQLRYYKRSFKSKKMGRAPESDWVRVKKTHEPIISEELYSLAQEILIKRRDKYRCGPSIPHLFTSLLYCHECGSPMYYKKDKNRNGIYRCGNYVKHGTKVCSSHYIDEDELKQVIIENLRGIINEHLDSDILCSDILECCLKEKGCLNEKLMDCSKLIIKNRSKIENLYRDKLEGIIDDDLFFRLSREIYFEMGELERQAAGIHDNIKTMEMDREKRVLQSEILKYINFETGLDREMLEWLVDKIEIEEGGGIIINFKFTI